MLVFTRRPGEKVYIGDDVVITVTAVRGDRVHLGFACPPHVPVHREEIYRRIRKEQSAKAPSERAQSGQESSYYAEFA